MKLITGGGARNSFLNGELHGRLIIHRDTNAHRKGFFSLSRGGSEG